LTGKGFAVAGLVCGILTVVLGIAFLVFMANYAGRPQSPFLETDSKIAAVVLRCSIVR
jgi:hypothetical protein